LGNQGLCCGMEGALRGVIASSDAYFSHILGLIPTKYLCVDAVDDSSGLEVVRGKGEGDAFAKASAAVAKHSKRQKLDSTGMYATTSGGLNGQKATGIVTKREGDVVAGADHPKLTLKLPDSLGMHLISCHMAFGIPHLCKLIFQLSFEVWILTCYSAGAKLSRADLQHRLQSKMQASLDSVWLLIV
jgi:hypothetical protein